MSYISSDSDSKFCLTTLSEYESMTKERLLSIDHQLIEKCGVVSKEIASLMCVNGTAILDSDICVSFTGNAGPEAMEEKPVGEVYIGLNYFGQISVYRLELSGSRYDIVEKAIQFITKKMIEKLK